MKHSYITLNCKLCNGSDFKHMFTKTDNARYLKKPVDIHVSRCKTCGFIMANPRLSDIYGLYNKDYYKEEFSHVDKKIKDAIIETSSRAFRRIKKISGKHNGRLIDVGCGSGLFLIGVMASGGKWELHGLDIKNCLENKAKGKIKFHKGLIEKFDASKGYFDVVSMIEVAGHMPDPVKTFKNVNKILKPGGWLFISTTNLDSIVTRIRGRREAYYKAPHVSYWSPKTIRACMEKCGFKVRKISNLYNGFWIAYKKTGNIHYIKNSILAEVANRMHIGDTFLIGRMNVFAEKVYST